MLDSEPFRIIWWVLQSKKPFIWSLNLQKSFKQNTFLFQSNPDVALWGPLAVQSKARPYNPTFWPHHYHERMYFLSYSILLPRISTILGTIWAKLAFRLPETWNEKWIRQLRLDENEISITSIACKSSQWYCHNGREPFCLEPLPKELADLVVCQDKSRPNSHILEGFRLKDLG